MIVFLFCIALPIFCFYYCEYGMPWQYINWKTVYIENGASFKIPENWVVTEQDGYIFFTDKPLEENYTLYMIGPVQFESIQYTSEEDVFRHRDMPYILPKYISTNVVQGYSIYSAIVKTNASYAYDNFIIDDIPCERYTIYFCGKVYMIWDDSISENLVIKIARSYRMN